MTETKPEDLEPRDSGSSADPSKPTQATDEERAQFEAAEANPDKTSLYIKRCGYGDMTFYEGADPKSLGDPAYYVQVSKKLVGWDITLRRGGKDGEPILHLKKAVRFLSLLGWDKGSKMQIKHADSLGKEGSAQGSAKALTTAGDSTTSYGSGTSKDTGFSKDTEKEPESFVTEEDEDEEHEDPKAPEELNPSFRHRDDELALAPKEQSELDNELTESMKQLNVQGSDKSAAPVCVLQRKHAFRSNRNTFEYNGATYAWDYKIFIGAMHTLKNLETNEIVAVCQLKAGVRMQSITAWGLRQNGCLEIMGSGHQMQDMIVATLIGMLEWRKHNNKVWIILAAAMPV